MIQVYFSHTGDPSLAGISGPEPVKPGQLEDILAEMEGHHPGLRKEVLDPSGKQINSATMIFKRIVIDPEGRLLESKFTRAVKNLNDMIDEEDENLLIALFHPQGLLKFLLETLTRSEDRFQYRGGDKEYRAYISAPQDTRGNQNLFVEVTPEPLYPFTYGRAIRELKTDGLIDVEKHKFIPAALLYSIAKLWDIEADFRLRLFQEEVLIHILNELAQIDDSVRQPLLLSIPTGGGKTEAFLIPLIAHLYDERTRRLQSNRIPKASVRSIVMYPTRALANDQARRIAEILYQMNQDAIEDRKISIGVLTGDTPTSGYNLLTEKSLLQLCPRCSSVLTDFSEKKVQESKRPLTIARCICGAEIDYFRLTRTDILNYPPDILITSPDMINRMLQVPGYHNKVFSPDISIVILDEIHMYNGVFGCNVAHLLRRFEEACKRKPLYVGVSATIRNAKELACLIFDADLDQVKYLRPAGQNEQETEEKRPYLDYTMMPARYRYHYALTPATLASGQNQKVTTSVLNVADVIGHVLRDPHFRKTLIFSNFRQDTDDIVRFLRDQEDRYYSPYHHELLPRILAMHGSNGQSLGFSKAELDIISAVDRWYRRARELGVLYEPGLELGWHRGGLEREERIKAVNRFATTQRLDVPDEDKSELPIDVMVATSTLELGIDIGDVTTVINCGAPFTTNEYTQRVGRGGRRKDALALTVIDTRNPLDFYFLKHFKQYARPTPDDFEDAPIIVSNLEIMKSHIYARLLDWLARHLNGDFVGEIKVSDLRNYKGSSTESRKTFQEDWQSFSEHLFAEIFTPAVFQRLQNWIKREAHFIPGIHATEITIDEIKSWWQGKCGQLYNRMRKDLQDTDELSGMASKDRDLVPDLRSSGPSVGLYLVREGSEDELKDTVSRRQAINSRPVGGYASQGSVTFKIEAIKDEDFDTEERIKRLLSRSPDGAKATLYFSEMFGDQESSSPFPAEPYEVLIQVQFKTPRDLLVKYNPYRFYCPRCGATYSDKKAGDERCNYCFGTLRQLTEVYMCGGCGEVYLPPVPKVCLNPDCIEQAKDRKSQTSFMPDGYKRVGKGDLHNNYFRFTALPMLHWRCRACGTEMNYHAYYELSQPIIKQIENAGWSKDTPAGIAKSFLYTPESVWQKTYAKDGFNEARFNCKKCKADNKYRKIHVKNIPSFRSAVHEYIIEEKEFAPQLLTKLGTLDFKRVNIITLAREHFRRFYSHRTNEMDIDLKPIFPDKNNYLANTYGTHAAFFRFGDVLSTFLEANTSAFTCHLGVQCSCHREDTAQVLDEMAEIEEARTKPVPAKLPWEMGRKPDPRRKWCGVVRGKVPGQECPGEAALCSSCPYFDRKRQQRYLILHTLEHAIITAMPKYTGINKNQVRGTVYPNDEQHYDLVLVDTIEGGSGSLYLLRKNWDRIWAVTGELLDAARREQGQLVLPYTCSRYNYDLCPHLTYAFYQYLAL
jgi:ATP-dependent helicase YprA (DUF1998 family)